MVKRKGKKAFRIVSIIALYLLVLGGVNWLLIGIGDFNFVSMIWNDTLFKRVFYTVIGLSGVWSVIPITKWAVSK